MTTAKTPTPEGDIRAQAEQLTGMIHGIVVGISDYFVKVTRAGEDVNPLRETARDVLVKKGFGFVQAANVVRLAIHRANLTLNGKSPYSESDIREICSRVSKMA